MTDKPYYQRVLTFFSVPTFFNWVVAAIVLYVLAICPLAFLRGAGVLNDHAVDMIRPIYAPLRNSPAVWLFAGLEQQFDGLGRRFHK